MAEPEPGAAAVPAWVIGVTWAGLAGVVLYVAGWIVAGVARPGYAARDRAISELFELGAPWGSRWPLVAGLVLSGIALIAFAPALHRVLPGAGRTGPWLVAIAGLGTLAALAAPCTPGCPGPEGGALDTAHTLAAGTGYLALVLAPLAIGWRVRAAAPRLAAWSFVLGGVALAGFAVRFLGVLDVALGWQQRVFNTVADAWYVLVAVWILRRARHRRAGVGGTVA